ncbi:MAG: glutamyl-tRNA reductase [Acidobacteriia bacterium]|nr:glutamyl-tRNA reductase [Terriglobia bacterium]
MEPCLMVIGVNYRTAPVAVRERFWISEPRRYEALVQLSRAQAIDEVAVLATCNRTEFILWTRDAAAASGSVLNFLTREYGLKLCEWKHFYRKIDEQALTHVFRVASSLDSMIVGEPEIVAQVKAAWAVAQQVGTTGRFLDSVFQKALTVSKRVRNETAISNAAVSVPYAAVQLAKQIFGSLQDRKVLLLGAGKMSETAARYLIKNGANDVRVMNRTLEHAQELATALNGKAFRLEERLAQVREADVVISSTSCPHVILTRDEMEQIVERRDGAPLLLVDIAVPRDIDPEVRQVNGVFLYDIDELEQVTKKNEGERKNAAAGAEKIVAEEARAFRGKLAAERVVPTIVALRGRLEEISRQEVEAFKQEAGPFTEEQVRTLETLAARITQRISGLLARELKEVPEKLEQDRMTEAVQRLFHLEQLQQAVAETRN